MRRSVYVGVLLTVIALGLACAGAWSFAAPAEAQENCPNEQLRGQQIYAMRLPDCRAYEQVSPVEKNGNDALGETEVVQASPSGEGVTFFSLSPFPGVAGAAQSPIYLGSRVGGEWSTQSLLPKANVGEEPLVSGLTEDLSIALVDVRATESDGESAYLRDSATGTFELIGHGALYSQSEAHFAAATPTDSSILFEDAASELIPGVKNETYEPYLYAWDENRPPAERLSVVGIVDGAPAASVAGAAEQALAQNAISEDGSRVFFTDLENGQVYLREPEAEKTIAVSAGRAVWRAATPGGRYAFYTEAGILYRFDVSSEAREVLTQPTTGSAEVLGTLGISTDGSYVYFVARGVLAENENGNKEIAAEGAYNLYEWHEGAPIDFMARLSERDEPDWFSERNGGSIREAQKQSRVTPAGGTVLFASYEKLTSYEHAGYQEFYLYDASSGTLACVSCNPSSAPATGETRLAQGESLSVTAITSPFLTRNLSEDGDRVFFQTAQNLLQQDTNSLMNVYEWERENAGSCERSDQSFSESSGGCLYLISTGQSTSESYFGNASADGSDVFFFTRQSLVSQDQDNNMDLYDARVGGGIPAQNPLLPPAPCAGEACRTEAGASTPLFGAPASTTLSGVGNLASPVSTPATQPKAKPLTRAQKLTKALKACKKRPKRRRARCTKQARRKYGKLADKRAPAHKTDGRHHS